MIALRINFHGPFRIASGDAAPGVDSAVDPRSLVPESSLKGVMRAAAATLGFPQHVVDEVFGTASQPSPWAWGPVSFPEEPVVSTRTRIRVDGDTGTVAAGALVMAHEVWVPSALFDLFPTSYLEEETRQRHSAVLVTAARSVRSLGASRNRGMGWVSLDVLSGGEGVSPSKVLELMGVTR